MKTATRKELRKALANLANDGHIKNFFEPSSNPCLHWLVDELDGTRRFFKSDEAVETYLMTDHYITF